MPLKKTCLPCFCWGLLLIASDTALAQQTPASSELPAAEATILEQQNRLLAEELPAAANWLQAGDETFLALWQPSSSGKQKGIVLMLPAQGQTANGWGSFAYLRRTLPEHGWATLSIALPAADLPPAGRLPIEPTDDAEVADTPAVEPSADEGARIDQRIASALAFIQQRAPGQRVVLLGEGAGATRGVSYFSNLAKPAPISAAVLLNARNTLPGDTFDLANALLEGVPVLDLFAQHNVADSSAAKARKTAAQAGQLPDYQQIGLGAQAPHPSVATPASQYIQGFLRRLSKK